mmetsp:Transcript_30256/g.60229  ORF Transcript_30256/g.60229 Transcript_30256/m.60229 type:complete len:331 (+) Transcript_30256:70-1062(+)
MAMIMSQLSEKISHPSDQTNVDGEDDMLNMGFDFTSNFFNHSHNSSSSSSITFSDFDNDSLQSTHTTNSCSGSGAPARKTHKGKQKVKKSSKPQYGSKLDQSLVPHGGARTEEWFSTQRAPNLSRKFRGLKLYAFPTFDKCDSLVFFPSSMSRHLNCGDFKSLNRLMISHLHRDCSVCISPHGNYRISAAMFAKMFEVMNDAHPDSVLCVHTTKVIDNTINARMYFKFTDSQIINRSVANCVADEPLSTIMAQPRSDRFKDNMNLDTKTEAEKAELNAIVDSEVDLIVYGKVDFKLVFDTAKKVTSIDFMCEFTSLGTQDVDAVMAGDDC